MSDTTNPATKHTGPANFAQQPVSAETQGPGSEIYMLVLQDVIERAEFGARKYGHPLRTTADVDYLVNAYQETLDLLIYLRGEIAKRDHEKFEDSPARDGMLEAAWGLIANAGWNAGTGAVDEAKTTGWHEAAIRWRDSYFALLSYPPVTVIPEPLGGVAPAQDAVDTSSPVG